LTIDRLAGNGDSVVSATGEMAGEPLRFVPAANGRLQALGAIPIGASDSVVARAVLTRQSGAVDTVRLYLKYPHQPAPAAAAPSPAGSRVRLAGARRLRVDPRFTRRLDAETEERVEQENQRAREVGKHAQNTPPLWTLSFLRPRDTKVTSRFGSGRLFNGRVSSSHLGVDYRGALGEPIHAANRGVVALVAEFFLAGNVVYIDHGGGIVTGYFHMSQPEVAVGDTVERGQEIGLVGSTGRVTGPHLHFSARFGAITIDPAGLLALGPPFATIADKRTSAATDESHRPAPRR
jgi:murein DD-endopeptidase MepM/ murein hydrolase activator NlpD